MLTFHRVWIDVVSGQREDEIFKAADYVEAQKKEKPQFLKEKEATSKCFYEPGTLITEEEMLW